MGRNAMGLVVEAAEVFGKTCYNLRRNDVSIMVLLAQQNCVRPVRRPKNQILATELLSSSNVDIMRTSVAF